ncbi:hypothetical protein FocTR4_00009340 [Fusarium oxysporum f. sp. cubense]|uniref:Uncharacterized protein n=1 Tax=Fusarium oxysporum f. sp. cubense TaxID=61366 RepID=A0A5C6ST49_FUSOC|nr:hypothetical protein FocTR4_00009340 [Fusarium oxysporum f. sp. cubense]
MMIFNLFNIAILTLGNQVFATPVLGDNTLHARSPPPPPPPQPPIPPAPPATTTNKSTVEIHPRIAPQVGPIPKIHLVPRHQLDNFAGKPVPPHRPHQRRDLPDIGKVAAYPFGKLPDFVKDNSGSLVGPRHVLIARHCFGDKLADSISFESNFFEGRSGGKSHATDVITLDGLECQKKPKDGEEKFNCALLNDWAILILADRMGETHGYLGVKEFDTKTLMNKQPFSHVGFPNKFFAEHQEDPCFEWKMG